MYGYFKKEHTIKLLRYTVYTNDSLINLPDKSNIACYFTVYTHARTHTHTHTRACTHTHKHNCMIVQNAQTHTIHKITVALSHTKMCNSTHT